MRRTTTDSQRFEFPMPLQNVDDLQLTYSQSGSIKIVKGMDDVSIDDKTVEVNLTQQETALFNAEIPVEVQAKISTTDGKIMASKILRIPSTKILNDTLMGED